MAPKGMKRPAGGMSAEALLKRQRAREISTKSDLVAQELDGAGHLSHAVRSALAEAAPSCLSEYKDQRHPYQDGVVAMVSTTLDGVEAGIQSEVQGAQATVNGIEAEKITRDNNKTAAEATLEEKKAALTAAKEALAQAQGDEHASQKGLKAAQKHLNDYDDDFEAAADALKEATNRMEAFATGPKAGFEELTNRTTPPPPAPVEHEGHSYYENVDGRHCDRAMIDACREAVAGRGDGRVSLDDARKVFAKMADGNKITRNERWTARYCMSEFKWTEAALKWIHEEAKKVKQEDEDRKEDGDEAHDAKRHKSYYVTIDGVKCDRGIVDACRKGVEGLRDGRISVADAQKVFAQVADGNKVTRAERWTVRYCLTKFHWTEAAHDHFMAQMKTISHDE